MKLTRMPGLPGESKQTYAWLHTCSSMCQPLLAHMHVHPLGWRNPLTPHIIPLASKLTRSLPLFVAQTDPSLGTHPPLGTRLSPVSLPPFLPLACMYAWCSTPVLTHTHAVPCMAPSLLDACSAHTCPQPPLAERLQMPAGRAKSHPSKKLLPCIWGLVLPERGELSPLKLPPYTFSRPLALPAA